MAIWVSNKAIGQSIPSIVTGGLEKIVVRSCILYWQSSIELAERKFSFSDEFVEKMVLSSMAELISVKPKRAPSKFAVDRLLSHRQASGK